MFCATSGVRGPWLACRAYLETPSFGRAKAALARIRREADSHLVWMRRTEALQGVRMAMFLNILNRWESAELNQVEAAEWLGVSERTFRRWTRRDV
jgi:hypothetical protein